MMMCALSAGSPGEYLLLSRAYGAPRAWGAVYANAPAIVPREDAMWHDSERAVKRAALEEFYGGEVPDSTVDRVIVIEADELASPFVD